MRQAAARNIEASNIGIIRGNLVPRGDVRFGHDLRLPTSAAT